MADKEVEQQNRTLKELVDNQKETNKTLTTGFAALQKSGAEDSTFMSKNLGSLMEVAATMKAQKKSEQFDKREQVTEVDEKVEKLTEENVKEGKKSRNLLRAIAEISTTTHEKGQLAASKATEMAREGSEKLKKLGDTIVKGVGKVFHETWGNMTKAAKRLTFGGLLFAAFMVAFMNFLDSDFFNKGFDILRNTIIPMIGKAWDIIKRIASWVGEFFDPLIKDIQNYIKSGDEWGIEGKIRKKTVVQIFIDNWKQILGGILGLSVLLAPGLVFGTFWKAGKWVIHKTFGTAIRLLLSSLVALPALFSGAALGVAGAGTAGAAAAARNIAAKPTKGAKITEGRHAGARFAGNMWVKGQGAGTPLPKIDQQALTQQWQKTRTASVWKTLGQRGKNLKAVAKGFGPLAITLGAVFSGMEAYNIIMDKTMKRDEKVKRLGALLFGTIGSVGFGILGAGLGSLVLPGIGTIAGAALGAYGGYEAGQYLASWLLGEPAKVPSQRIDHGGYEGGYEGIGGWGGAGPDMNFGGYRKRPPMDLTSTERSMMEKRDKRIAGLAALDIEGSEERRLAGTDFLLGGAQTVEGYSREQIKKDQTNFLEDLGTAIVDGIVKATNVIGSGTTLNNISSDLSTTVIASKGMTNGNLAAATATSRQRQMLNYYSMSSSDIRLKEDIELLGKSPSGINIYSFKYIGEEEKYQGVMAQEVLWASAPDEKGYYSVDYSKLDVDFKRLN